jgi:hypothetical protein
MAINLATGSCVTAMNLLYIASFAIRVLFINLFNFSYANGEIAAVSAVYRTARVRIHEMLVRVNNEEVRIDDRIVEDLKTHDRALAGLATDGAEFSERIFGVVVDAGLARSLLVGALTLGVTLYTVLRNAGIFATIEVFCPII